MPANPPPPPRRRIREVLGAALLVTALVAAPDTAGAAWLKPDLEILDRGPIRLCQERLATVRDRDACTGRGRTVLRVPSYIANVGAGPLEYVPARRDVPADCHGDGPRITKSGVALDNDVLVRQRLYRDRDRDGVFARGADTGARSLPVGCRYYHPVHNHFHIESFARFELLSAATGSIVRIGPKLSFCVGDRDPFDLSLPGAPSDAGGEGYYGFSDCHRRLSTQGSSVGWYDLYGWKLAGQEIDVTRLPAGRYCLVARVDPEDRLAEANRRNDQLVREIRLNPAAAPTGSGRALASAAGCRVAPGERPRTLEATALGVMAAGEAAVSVAHPAAQSSAGGPTLTAPPDQVMRPSRDLVTGWDVSGSSLAWLALADQQTVRPQPNGDAYLRPSSPGQVSEVEVGPLPQRPPRRATAWVYCRTWGHTQLQIDVRSSGATWDTLAVAAGAPYAWRGVQLAPPPAGQAGLDNLSLRFTAVGGNDAIVRGAWVEIEG